jgi:hypothetical protein
VRKRDDLVRRKARLTALPVGETRGSKGQGGTPGGGSPGLHGAKRRKTGDTRRAGGEAA